MRVLHGPDAADPADPADLAELYAAPRLPWLRVNFVSTVDGAATGPDGRSGGINNEADKRVFDQLRALADAVIVGAGTLRAEGYTPIEKPLVVVSRRGEVPERLRGAPPGRVLMATCGAAERLEEARRLLGPENVLVLGSHRVDLPLLKQVLVDRGWTDLLSEGGPHLLRDLVESGAADELCLTVVPRLLAGEHPRIAMGPPVDVPLRLRLMLEDEGTLLTRWDVARPSE